MKMPTKIMFYYSYIPASGLTFGGWNTIPLLLPGTAALPLFRMGVQFYTSGAAGVISSTKIYKHASRLEDRLPIRRVASRFEKWRTIGMGQTVVLLAEDEEITNK